MSPTNYQYTQMKPMNEKMNKQKNKWLTDWWKKGRKECMHILGEMISGRDNAEFEINSVQDSKVHLCQDWMLHKQFIS